MAMAMAAIETRARAKSSRYRAFRREWKKEKDEFRKLTLQV
jgi:hypothetical protein